MRPTAPLGPGSTSIRRAGYKWQDKPFLIMLTFLPFQLFLFYLQLYLS